MRNLGKQVKRPISLPTSVYLITKNTQLCGVIIELRIRIVFSRYQPFHAKLLFYFAFQ